MTSDGLVDASGNRNEVYFVNDGGKDDKCPCCTVGDSSFQSIKITSPVMPSLSYHLVSCYLLIL